MAYKNRFEIAYEQTDSSGKLRLSELLMIAQKDATEHVKLLGFGPDRTFERGYLWVIARQRFVIDSLPNYIDEVESETHPAPMRAFVYPRHYSLRKDDKVIVRGVAAWMLIDAKERKVLTPSQSGIVIPGEAGEGELPFPTSLSAPELTQQVKLRAKWSMCDANRHLNNTKYLDLCEDLLPEGFLLSHPAKEVSCEYKKEIKLGEEFTISYGEAEGAYWFTSDRFIIRIAY